MMQFLGSQLKLKLEFNRKTDSDDYLDNTQLKKLLASIKFKKYIPHYGD